MRWVCVTGLVFWMTALAGSGHAVLAAPAATTHSEAPREMPAERSPDAPPEGAAHNTPEKHSPPDNAPDTMPGAAIPQPETEEPSRTAEPEKTPEQAPAETPAPPAPAPAAAAEAPAAPPVKQPYEWTRALEAVQNQIISGNRGAHIIQKQLIADIGNELATVPDTVWSDPRNPRAVITYVLSGGDPRALIKLMKQGEAATGISEPLLKGLYAYARGRNKEAIDALETVSARTFDPGPGGHLALAQATLMSDRNATKALEYLDEARLLAPGTLVEEAALRRSVTLAQGLQDFDKAMQIMSLYMRRFHQSVYASTFRWSFSRGFATSKFANDDTFVKRLFDEIETFDPDRKKALYLSLAEESTINGKVDVSRKSAQKLAELVKDDAKLMTRAQLYEAATLIFTDEYEHAATTINAIDPKILTRRDRDLLKATRIVAKRLREPVAENVSAEPPLASATQGKSGVMDEMSPVVKAGQAALATANELLNGSGP